MRSIKFHSATTLIATAMLSFGCDPIDETGGGTTGEPPTECAEGSHLETVCDDACGECKDECVPDSVCPPGTKEAWTCEDVTPSCEDGSSDCAGPGPEPSCYLDCFPENPCGDGYHVDWVCDPTYGEYEDAPADPNDPSEPPPSDCYDICVPDSVCPPGSHEEWTCDDVRKDDGSSSDGEEAPPEPCSSTCVPDNVCPPGSHEEWTCDDVTGECYPGGCAPDACEPGSHEEWTCTDPGPCSHDKCVVGAALSDACDPVVGPVCELDPFCCESFWDAICIGEATDLGAICDDPGNYPPAPPEDCTSVCVPDDKECPPGQHLEAFFDNDDVEFICVDDGEPTPG